MIPVIFLVFLKLKRISLYFIIQIKIYQILYTFAF